VWAEAKAWFAALHACPAASNSPGVADRCSISIFPPVCHIANRWQNSGLDYSSEHVSARIAVTIEDIATAMQRVEGALKRKPAAGMHDDAPAAARWQTGLRIAASHANGTQVLTDMPAGLGGSGDQVTPGWLLRAGLASCLATRIAMGAAATAIQLTFLEVLASSRSDARGLFGMVDVSGEPVGAGPRGVQLLVRISAAGVSAKRLQELVEDCDRCSPVSTALRDKVPVALRVEVM
jgi:organic hydroperoxide reductase OsmC/OhrA